MTSPYILPGIVYAHELRRFRIDSDKGLGESLTRRMLRKGIYTVRNSVSQYTALVAAASLSVLTQGIA